MWNKPIHKFDYRVEFTFKALSSEWGAVSWSEEHSPDPNPSYNGRSLGILVGHTNGKSFTDAEKKLIENGVMSLSEKIKSFCGIDADFHKTVY